MENYTIAGTNCPNLLKIKLFLMLENNSCLSTFWGCSSLVGLRQSDIYITVVYFREIVCELFLYHGLFAFIIFKEYFYLKKSTLEQNWTNSLMFVVLSLTNSVVILRVFLGEFLATRYSNLCIFCNTRKILE